MGAPLTEGIWYEDIVKIACKNSVCKLLFKIWKKIRDKIASGLSSTALVLWHPRFRVEARCFNSLRWEETGLVQFYSLGSNGHMLPSQEIYNFQNIQVWNLIGHLNSRQDIFWSLTQFESCFDASTSAQKFFSKLFTLLRSLVTTPVR